MNCTKLSCHAPSLFSFCSETSHLFSQIIVKLFQSTCPSYYAIQTAFVMRDNDLNTANSKGQSLVLISCDHSTQAGSLDTIDYFLPLCIFFSLDFTCYILSSFPSYLTCNFFSQSPLEFLSFQPELLIREHTRSVLGFLSNLYSLFRLSHKVSWL